jgi:hypothetical protein
VKNGVPAHIALGQKFDQPGPTRFDRTERMAMSIIYSEMEGNEFDFATMSWKQKD